MATDNAVPVAADEAAPGDIDRFAQNLQARIGERLRPGGEVRSDDLRELVDAELKTLFHLEEQRRINRGSGPLGQDAEAAITRAVKDRYFSYGPLQTFLDPGSGISEINLTGGDQVWVTHVDGTREHLPALFESDRELEAWVERHARESGRHEYRWDFAHPILEMDLPNGDRLSAVREVTPRPVVAIRRHDLVNLATLDDLVRVRMIDDWTRGFLTALVRARKNLIVSGGTSAGKTTLARALGNTIPRWERVLTVEDVAELRLEYFSDLHDQVVRSDDVRPTATVAGKWAWPR
ncbi:MAG: pilus assembly protein CpaF [Actinomycetota bacterium]|jgi:Flp pilus assembly CpaF family ATPase|nr:pilus assembly protein CpaF [Actinomycetota bacterium]